MHAVEVHATCCSSPKTQQEHFLTPSPVNRFLPQAIAPSSRILSPAFCTCSTYQSDKTQICSLVCDIRGVPRVSTDRWKGLP